MRHFDGNFIKKLLKNSLKIKEFDKEKYYWDGKFEEISTVSGKLMEILRKFTIFCWKIHNFLRESLVLRKKFCFFIEKLRFSIRKLRYSIEKFYFPWKNPSLSWNISNFCWKHSHFPAKYTKFNSESLKLSMKIDKNLKILKS